MIYDINRFHFIVLLTWQFVVFLGGQQIFPIFSNYIPKWRCGDDGPMGFDCKEYARCNGTVQFAEIAFQSAALEFNWICDRRYYATLASQLQFFGLLVGTVTFGPAADAFGRKPFSVVTLVMGITAGCASGLAKSAIPYYIARFIVGISGGGGSVCVSIFINEHLLPQQRMVLRGLFNWGIGRLAVTVVCMVIGEWRTSVIAIALIASPALFIVVLFLPESPTWLHSKNRNEELIKCERTIARRAGVEYTPQTHRRVVKQKSLCQILQNREMFRRLSVLWIMWFTASTCSYAIDLNSSTLSGDFYVNQILFSVIIYVSKLILLAIDTNFYWCSRRVLHQVSQSGAIVSFGILYILTYFKYEGVLYMIFSLIGTVFIEYTWDSCYLCAIESLETAERASGTGSCSCIARVGSIFSPALAYFNLIYPGSVYLTVVGLGIVCLIVSCSMLVETKGVELDNVVLGTVEDEANAEAQELTTLKE